MANPIEYEIIENNAAENVTIIVHSTRDMHEAHHVFEQHSTDPIYEGSTILIRVLLNGKFLGYA